jgi:hypothetical protein
MVQGREERVISVIMKEKGKERDESTYLYRREEVRRKEGLKIK